MDNLSIRQISPKWHLPKRWASDLCTDGRIPSALKIGSCWVISKETVKPADARIKSGNT